MRSDQDLRTPGMDQAERELDARANYALDLGRGLAEKAAQLDQRLDEREPPSDEDVERMKKYVLGHAMTEEWRQVVARIDRGELTWREIVDGLFHGTLDREVSAAFRSLSRVPPASVEELVQLGVLPTPPSERPPIAGPRTTATHRDDDDDEWFDDPLRRRPR